jgi:hypothetical protein
MIHAPEPKQTVNSLRDAGIARAEASGDGQRPFKIIQPPCRKRAYHRALKRGEYWAVMRKFLNDCLKIYP